MKSTGIRRKVDDLGRVVIPAGIRRSLDIREGDQVEVHVEGDQVILAKPVDRCVFCQAEDDLQPYRGKVVCRGCVASVGVLDENLRRQRTVEPGPSHVQAVPDDARPTQPLPPWTDSGRQRPPLQSAPAARRPEPAPQAEPEPEPAAAAAPEPDREQRPSTPAEPRRYEDPPASTAW